MLGGRRRALATFLVFLLVFVLLSALIAAFAVPLVNEGTKLAGQLPGLIDDARSGRGPIGDLLQRTNALQYLNAIIQDRATMGDTKVKLLDLGNEDATMSGCDWHPSAADHQRMADIMAKQLKADLGW